MTSSSPDRGKAHLAWPFRSGARGRSKERAEMGKGEDSSTVLDLRMMGMKVNPAGRDDYFDYRIQDGSAGATESVQVEDPAGADNNVSMDSVHRKLALLKGHKLVLRVRTLYGDEERDTKLVFSSEVVTAGEVCEVMRNKLGLTSAESSLFSLWSIGREFEYQLQNHLNLAIVMKSWFKVPDNRSPKSRAYILLYRRGAILNYNYEARFNSPTMINLLYAEARFNVLKGRYPCDLEDAVYLGGLIIHSYVGRYNPAKHTSGYISSCLYKYVLPGRFHRLCSSSKWESALGKYHSKFKDLTVYQARYLFVSYVRRWPTYGSSYFPICVDRPLSGFFELRTQLWYLGINVRGIFVFDAYNYAHLFDAKWKQVKSMQYSADTVKVVVAPGSKDNTKSKKKKDAHVIRLLSPQAPLIYNLATKCRVVNILERLSYNTREHSDLEVLMKPMGSLNPNLPQAPISKKESDEFDSILHKERTPVGRDAPVSSLSLSTNDIGHTNDGMLSPPLTGSARKNPGDDEVQVPGQPTSDSQLGKNASRADAKNGNTNSGMGPRDLGFGVIPGNDSIGHSSSWVIPRKINGPVKIPKSDGATLFVCSFAQPSSNFSRDPETTTINVIK